MFLYFGWMAATLSITYRLPQIYHTYTQKTVSDLSYSSLLLQLVLCVLFTLHSLEISDPPTLVSGVGGIIQAIIMVILYHIYTNEIITDVDRI